MKTLLDLPLELIDEISNILHELDKKSFYNFRRISRVLLRHLKPIKSQQEFDFLLSTRYRKDAFRVYGQCWKFLTPNQAFVLKACEYSNIENLEILLQLSEERSRNINWMQVFYHCCSLNLAVPCKLLIGSNRDIDPSSDDNRALKSAAYQVSH